MQEGDIPDDAHRHIQQGQARERPGPGDEIEEILPVPEDQVREAGGEVVGQELVVAGYVTVLVGVDVIIVQLPQDLLVRAEVAFGAGDDECLSGESRSSGAGRAKPRS